MQVGGTPRYCRCGTRLGRDRAGKLCGQCEKNLVSLWTTPPDLPADFWDTPALQDAFSAQHIGHVCRAYRKHSYHRAVYGTGGISQEMVGRWMGLTQAQISRIESGAPVRQLDNLARWARTLRIPAHHLWFRLPPQPEGTPVVGDGRDPVSARVQPQGDPENEDVDRRELLRLISMVGASLAAPLEWGSIADGAGALSRLSEETLDEYKALNSHLWQVFALSTAKAKTLPLVRGQIAVLVDSLRHSQSLRARQRLCGLAADLFQLAGEIFFDSNEYTEAAHCYTLAASASKEAEAFDLWACALTRHAFIDVYERQFSAASPVLELADKLARRGDGTLSTRHWVAAVQAETFAGLGQQSLCERALDMAEEVHQLPGPVHNGGWLRFDGSRLAEERGTCYVALHRPDLAEAALNTALAQHLSSRRRGSVLVDLAILGLQRRDRDFLLTHADASLELARQTGSGVIVRRIKGLQAKLGPMLADPDVYRLQQRIGAIVEPPAA
jgi:tetratricopeptide (TPR) repeat protein